MILWSTLPIYSNLHGWPDPFYLLYLIFIQAQNLLHAEFDYSLFRKE